MSILDDLIGLVAPHRCKGCNRDGALLCAGCAERLMRLPPRCYRCRALTELSKTCGSCRASSGLYRVTVSTPYESVAKELVWCLKFQGAQAAARDIAKHLARQYEGDERMVVVPVPTATGRIRQRGYDQANLLAREFARRSGRRFRPHLVRSGQQHQVGASRYQRLHQLADAFRVRGSVRGQTILLVDDVLTTGATLQAAATALKAAGAKRVEAIVFAQA